MKRSTDIKACCGAGCEGDCVGGAAAAGEVGLAEGDDVLEAAGEFEGDGACVGAAGEGDGLAAASGGGEGEGEVGEGCARLVPGDFGCLAAVD